MLTKDASEKQNTTLSAAKRALLEKRLRGEAIRNTPAVVIPKRSDVEFAPATFAQQRLWFLDQLEPGSTTYNVPIALRIRGQFEVSVLEQALNELLRRHETWRTTLESRDGLLIQHIHESGSFALSVQDVTALPVAEREREAMSLMREHAQIPFKLTEGPLVRALMVKLNETEHWLVLTQHHSITDGWSVGIILHEITVVYEALMMGKPSPLADLPVQYADYACWQQQTLSGQELEKQLEYWRQQLADAPPQLDLPTRKAHADQRTSHGSTLFFHLTRKLSDDLRALCQREGVTPFMTFLAAFQLLLYRYTGQDELVIGTNVANRVLPELEGIAGYFTNLLILRTDLAGNPTFRELLGRVRDVSLAAFAHQEVPCERAAARPYDLQVHFILQNTPTQSKSVAGLSAERIEFAGNTAICDLFLNVEDTEEISCFFEYNTDLFDDETIQRMSTHFQHLLEECAQHPERKLSTFSLLSAAERQQLLFAWNDARAVEQRRGCIHELFEEQAARTPQHPALESEGTVLTYQELNARANQVAHYLRTVGVTSEVTVGLCLERSIDLMVGMLGIVKAGGCYLPIDPAYPDERLQMILSDAQMPVLLTHSTLAPRFADQQSTVLCLDARLPQLAEVPTTNPAHLTTDGNAAYIIYTSGSTGKPKGVVISHRSLVNHSLALSREFEMSATDRVLQFASLSFDAAAEEIYPTWFSGATLILRPGYAPIGVSELRDFIEQKKLTLFQLPTAYWHQWVAQLSQNPLPLPNSLRLIYVGGEQVQPEFYRQWLQAVGTKVRWSNTYGPTEATITAIIYKNDGSPETVEAHADLAPIGLPMANAQAYVLDRELQPVPLGAVGELYLGGEGLARGYLKRPDLTAGSFIPNPYGQSGARMYRTGDLVRYLADGNLVYIGRRDQQVKVRGYRIELGEIEATLLHYPQIRECVVIAREDVPGDKYLAAYIVGNQSQDAVSEIRQFLSAHLPKYMLPASYIFLDRFPVTTSGKINRQALPIPTHERDADMETYVAPRTPVEKVLVGAWSEVLDGTQVGIYDDFFEIGGHSLRAIQLVARIQDVLSVDLPLRHVFEYSTVASMAEAMLQDESQRETINTAAELFLRVSNLSDEEVEALLNQ